MFYAPEFLLARKKGKFAKCWLAAKLSRVVFLRKYHRDTILQIAVSDTCEQLIPHISGIDASARFSLSLSSDLMFGIVKIHSYQSEVILQRCFEFWTKIKHVPSDRDDFQIGKKKGRKGVQVSDEMFLLPPPEIAIAETDFMRNQAREADITIKEIERSMQAEDQLNFGALTGDQMDQLLQPGGLFFGSPSTARVFPSPALPSNLPLPEIESPTASHIFKIPGTPRGRKTFRNGSGVAEKAAEINQSLDDIPTIDVPLESVEAPFVTDVIRPPGTPTKHKLPSEVDVTSSPKKRRGLQTEFDSDSTERPIPVPPAVAAIPLDNNINFGSLDENLIGERKKKKKRKFFDTNTELPGQYMRRATEDVFFQTRASTALEQKAIVNTMSAEELLTAPSTSKRWGKTLLLNYQMIILEPISQTLPVDSGFGDPIREPDSSTGERSGELSAEVIGKPGLSVDDTSSKDHSKTLEVIPMGVTSTPRIEVHPIQEETFPPEQEIPPKLSDFSPPVEEPHRTPTKRKSLANYPKAIRNIVRDWSENGETNRDPENRYAVENGEKSSTTDSIQRTPTGSLGRLDSSSSGRMSQEIMDTLGWLESLWSEYPVVGFKELCPADTTTKKQATVMFTRLLELSRLKEVKLTQASPYGPIYIQKYSPCI